MCDLGEIFNINPDNCDDGLQGVFLGGIGLLGALLLLVLVLLIALCCLCHKLRRNNASSEKKSRWVTCNP